MQSQDALKGIVLEEGRNRYVLCAVDWCELCNSTHQLFRRKIARAAATDEAFKEVVITVKSDDQEISQHVYVIANADYEKRVQSQ